MAGHAWACDIRHVADVLIWFRRPASGAAGRPRATTPDGHSTENGGRRGDGRSSGGPDRSADAHGHPDEEVRLLRLRRKVMSPRT